jgi:hypothetical protein
LPLDLDETFERLVSAFLSGLEQTLRLLAMSLISLRGSHKARSLRVRGTEPGSSCVASSRLSGTRRI